jgi:hypothetical protein
VFDISASSCLYCSGNCVIDCLRLNGLQVHPSLFRAQLTQLSPRRAEVRYRSRDAEQVTISKFCGRYFASLDCSTKQQL